jgi:hypothetical protein
MAYSLFQASNPSGALRLGQLLSNNLACVKLIGVNLTRTKLITINLRG